MPQGNQPIVVTQSGLTIPDNTTRLRDAKLNSPPPSLHEEVFSVPSEHAADEHIALAKSALRSCREAAVRAREVAQLILADRTRTELAQQRDASDAVHKATSPAMQKLQTAIEKLDAKVNALRDFLRGPALPRDAVQMLASMEARTALSQMPQAERRKLILQGIEEGDSSVLAFLRAAPYLSGISPLEQQEYQSRWAARNHPKVVSQLKILETALDATERGGKLLLGYGLSLTNMHEVEQARSLSERAAAAVASVSIERE